MTRRLLAVLSLILVATPSAYAASLKCGPDSVAVGSTCVDKFEASTWRIPAAQKGLIAKLKNGKATIADLQKGGAVQVCSIPLQNDTCETCTFGPTFPDDGNWTEPVYAASIKGTMPSTCITWFQAEQACRLAGKRLATNQEWQAAVAGTPDPNDDDDFTTTCNTLTTQPTAAGSRAACVSRWGAYDMIGNVWEWVADWGDLASLTDGCTFWGSDFQGDITCLGPNVTTSPGLVGPPASLSLGPPRTDIFPLDQRFPGARIRGGNFADGARNGAFAIYGAVPPHNRSRSTGFRCAR